jgi:hypothetical protein
MTIGRERNKRFICRGLLGAASASLYTQSNPSRPRGRSRSRFALEGQPGHAADPRRPVRTEPLPTALSVR